MGMQRYIPLELVFFVTIIIILGQGSTADEHRNLIYCFSTDIARPAVVRNGRHTAIHSPLIHWSKILGTTGVMLKETIHSGPNTSGCST